MTAPEDPLDRTIITHIEDLGGAPDKYAYLIFLSGPLMGKMYPLREGAIVLGRGHENEIAVTDSGISRRHCEIRFSKGKAFVRDLGSTNGTFLNGRQVQERELLDGDKVQISTSTIFKYAYQDRAENAFHEELFKMAIIDPLTGAHNKRYFEGRIKEDFSFAIRNNVPLSLVMFDIDHFKKINDTYGHPAGDYVLKQVCDVGRSIIRIEDTLIRYGGEEFLILLKGAGLPGALSVAERLRKGIEEQSFEFEGKKIGVTASLGIATLADRNFTDWENMLKLADTFLYKSKNAGRNRISHS